MGRALIRQREKIRASLLAWYARSARRLPWRTSPSLYGTVVSEFMLQQTQVKTVLPYFDRWLRQFPDFAALAAASPEEVLRAWEGLGYYSRARNLHRLAQAVVAMDAPPQGPAGWQELPGIGPYTAAAITSIAFDHPTACVDGNVVRILARLTADGTVYRDSASAAKAFSPLGQQLMDGTSRPGDFNQAMMELGATVCTKHNPQCLSCPLRKYCVAGRRADVASLPRLAPKVMEKKDVVRVWCIDQGALLLHRASATSARLAGLHELPTAEHLGLTASALGPLLAKKSRGITRYQITESIHEGCVGELPPPRNEARENLVWVPLERLRQITLSGPHRRWVTEIASRATAPAAASKVSRHPPTPAD